VSSTIQRHPLGLTWFESGGMERAAHAVLSGERVWLIDPFDDPAALTAAAELGSPAGVIQLLDRHNRDCASLAQRLGVPLHRLPPALRESPFTVVPVIANRWWREIALWWPQERTLIVAEAIGTAPLFALGRAAGVHPLLRVTPPRSALGGRHPERLLVGHGHALQTGADEALHDALSAAHSDIPRLLSKLPSMIRGR
jgi:hypothetical protein